MKLRAKIFLVFSLLSIIPLLILTGFSYMRYTQSIYQRMDEFSGHLFENAAETANNTLNNIARTTSLFTFTIGTVLRSSPIWNYLRILKTSRKSMNITRRPRYSTGPA